MMSEETSGKTSWWRVTRVRTPPPRTSTISRLAATRFSANQARARFIRPPRRLPAIGPSGSAPCRSVGRRPVRRGDRGHPHRHAVDRRVDGRDRHPLARREAGGDDHPIAVQAEDLDPPEAQPGRCRRRPWPAPVSRLGAAGRVVRVGHQHPAGRALERGGLRGRRLRPGSDRGRSVPVGPFAHRRPGQDVDAVGPAAGDRRVDEQAHGQGGSRSSPSRVPGSGSSGRSTRATRPSMRVRGSMAPAVRTIRAGQVWRAPPREADRATAGPSAMAPERSTSR